MKDAIVLTVMNSADRLRAALIIFMAGASGTAWGQPAIPGYADDEAAAVEALDASPLVEASTLATTPGGRPVRLLTVGTGDVHAKPAILLVGSVYGPHLVGAEVVLRMVQKIVADADQPPTRDFLNRFTLYVVPRPTPDAAAGFFQKPSREQVGNGGKSDDDRDASLGEDPPNDLDGDGWIAELRVADDAGDWKTDAKDPRVLVKIDRSKNESGAFRLHAEGGDDDGDEQWNEDPGDGAAFHRNFTYRYPYFKANAGANQVSEPETRAVVDFAFDHPNIALVWCFSLEDNLFHPWKTSNAPNAIEAGDGPSFEYMAKEYREIHGGKDAPAAAEGAGSFSEWAYHHYGRWSLAGRGWWIPKTPEEDAAKKPEAGKEPAKKADEKKEEGKDKKEDKAEDKRGDDALNALRWFAKEKIDGYAPWKEVELKDFPGRKVEVGGFRPF
ncbi:MAG: M14 family zinc carboxypeptidase, partial [Planctomycetia bacterium]